MNPQRNPIPSRRVRGLFAAAFLALLPWSHLAAEPAADLIAAAKRSDTAAASAALKAGAPTKGIPAAQALIAAAQRGDHPMTDLLLAAGVPVDEADDSGENALMNAAFKDRGELVAHLLERGAKATFVGHDENGGQHLALIGAIEAGSAKILRVLLDHGADPNGDAGGVLRAANFSGNAELYQMLKAAGGRDPEHLVMQLDGAREALEKFRSQAARDAAANAGLITLLAAKPPPAAARATPGKCRLAILADEPNAAAADLLTAQLASSPALQLVERGELDRVLAEQKLTRDLGAEAGARLAGLLGADALLLVSTREAASGRVVETRVVNVNRGLILASFFRPAPLADAPGWAAEIAAQLPALATRATTRDGFALTLLNVHATADTPSAREMEKTANLLLGNRLLREPGFYLLERSAFDQIAQEIALGKKGADTFWTGSFTVDAALNPPLTAGDEIALTLRFQPSDGTATEVQTRGPREKLAAVLDEAVAKIHAALTRTPPPAPPAQEAAHFVREAHWQVQAGQYRLARQSMDTAWALGAQDFATRHYRLLCHAWALQIPIRESLSSMEALLPAARRRGWASRDYFNQPFRRDDFPSVEAAFEGAFEILRQYEDGWNDIPAGDDARLAEWLDAGRDAVNAACFLPILLDSATMKMQHAEKLTALRAGVRDIYRRAISLTPPGTASARAHSELATELARYLLVWPDTFAQAKEAYRQIMGLHFLGMEDFFLRARLRQILRDAAWVCYAGYRHPQRPTAWVGSGFKWWWPMTPAQRQNLSEDFQNSPAADDRLRAWGDASRLATADLPGQQVALQMVMSILWEISPELARDGRLLDLCQNSCEPLAPTAFLSAAKGAARPDQNGSYFSGEIRAFRRALFAFLAPQQPDLSHCEYLLRREKFSPAEAAEILPALTAHFAAKDGGAARLRALCRTYDLPTPDDGFNIAAPAKPLAITKFWEPSRLGLDSGRSFGISASRMVWAEDRLWVVGDFSDRWMEDARCAPHVFSVEFPSMKTTAIPLPPITGKTVGHGAVSVTPKRLIVAEESMALLIYDRKKKTWETVPEIRPLYPPEILDDDLYVTIEGGVLRYDMGKKTVEILASTRRTPAQSPLDDPRLHAGRVRLRAGPELEIPASSGEGKDDCYGYSPATHVWRKIERAESAAHVSEWWHDRYPGSLGYAHVHAWKKAGPFLFSAEKTPSPAAGFELEFATDETIEARSRASNGPPISIQPQDIIATRHGWLISEFSGFGGGKYVWFLPLADLKKYLRENPAAAAMVAKYETRTGMTLVPKENP